MYAVPWTNEHAAAAAVREYLSPGPNRWLWLLPRSRFHPDSSLWWNIPSNAPVAYRFAKLFFDIRSEDPGALVCGLHVEKGYTEPGATTDPRQRMDQTWTWHRFLASLDTPEIGAALSSLESSGHPVTLLLLAHPDVHKAKPETLLFHLSNGVLMAAEGEPSDLLHGWSDASNLGDLKARIAAHPKLGWYWLNIFLGCAFSIGGTPEDPSTWNAQLVADRALAPWQTWLK